jgi:GNAT superfamily N-acetyltransferase
MFQSQILIWLGTIFSNPVTALALLTFILYTSSYMVYSGYISWFAGGYGGIPLSHAGFNVIDSLTLFPSIYLLILQGLWDLVKLYFRLFIQILVIPGLIASIIWLLLNQPSWPWLAQWGQTILGLGMFIIIASSIWGSVNYKKSIFSMNNVAVLVLGIIGWLLIMLSVALVKSTSFPTNPSTNVNWFFEISIILLIGEVTAFPFFAGLTLGERAAKNRTLSQISRLTLKSPIPGLEQSFINTESKSRKQKGASHPDNGQNSWLLKIEPDVFVWNANEKPIYLIAAFNQNTAFYVPPNQKISKHGKMLVVSNGQITSMEIKSKKVNAGLDTSHKIRQANQKDICEVCEIDDEAFSPYGTAESPQIFSLRLSAFPKGFIVLTVDSKVVAYGCSEKWLTEREPALDEDPAKTHYKDGKIFCITAMAVQKAYQNKGYGTAILEELEKIALKNKCKQVILETTHARSFYVERGYWVDTEREQNGIKLYVMKMDL